MTVEPDYYDTTDVLIIGAGPTGDLLSASLAKHSIKNIVLEKELEIWPYPRAIVIGEDGLRALQNVGIADDIYTQIAANPRGLILNLIGGDHFDYYRRPFIKLDHSFTGHTGHVNVVPFKQPMMEKCLRGVLEKNGFSDLRLGCNVHTIEEDNQWVYVSYRDHRGTEMLVRAKFLVGCDGKVGFTRKQYLEKRGVRLERTAPDEGVWVGANWHVRMPTPESHPEFPLWKLGYTPEQVYDAFIPVDFIVNANRHRRNIACRLGEPKDPNSLWRTEFATLPGEDPEKMDEYEKIKEVIFPYLKQPGSKYGLSVDVQYPEDCLELKSKVLFKFQARRCNKWHIGRTILAGDAAHVFPPHGGQGVLVGLMDAWGLAWRLALALRSPSADIDKLLVSWTIERKKAVDASLAFVVSNGARGEERNPFKLFMRDWILWLIQLIPSIRRSIERPQAEPIRYPYEKGVAFLPNFEGGRSFPQVYCKVLGSDEGQIRFTDDVIFAPGKQGLFQVVQLVDQPSEARVDGDLLTQIDKQANGYVVGKDMTILCKRGNIEKESKPVGISYAVVATAEDFEKSSLSRCRIRTDAYDEYRFWNTFPGKRYVIVRPDRFVFAACADEVELEHVLQSIESTLLGDVRSE